MLTAKQCNCLFPEAPEKCRWVLVKGEGVMACLGCRMLWADPAAALPFSWRQQLLQHSYWMGCEAARELLHFALSSTYTDAVQPFLHAFFSCSRETATLPNFNNEIVLGLVFCLFVCFPDNRVDQNLIDLFQMTKACCRAPVEVCHAIFELKISSSS